jgi:hypothetical protein
MILWINADVLQNIPLVGRLAMKGCTHYFCFFFNFCFLCRMYTVTAIISLATILKLLFARLASFLAAGHHGIAVGVAAMAS